MIGAGALLLYGVWYWFYYSPKPDHERRRQEALMGQSSTAMASGTPLHHNRGLAAFIGVLVIFGGYVLRYVFVYAGQLSYFR